VNYGSRDEAPPGRPRSELPRWSRLRPALDQAYVAMTVVAPHDADRDQARHLVRELGVSVAVATQPFSARFESLQAATADGTLHEGQSIGSNGVEFLFLSGTH
jgi:hypothetical protein